MQRKRIQPARRKKSGGPSKKKTSKSPASLAELLLNWLIGALIVLILAFVASLTWKFFVANKDDIFVSGSAASPEEAPLRQIRIEVLNGCGVTGVAGRFTDYLRAEGFDVVVTDNYRNFDVDSSFVIDRISMQSENALRIARSLGIRPERVEPIVSDELAVEATLVLGSDYASLNGYSEDQ